MVSDTFEFIKQKYSLDIGRQYIVSIPNMGRNDLAKLFCELEFNLGAEIGVGKGAFSEVLCKANPKLHLYCIDPLVTLDDPEMELLEKSRKNTDSDYQEALKKLAPYTCELMSKSSVEAAKYFPNESLDFVYIDGNHEFAEIASDLSIWSKKVRPGGIISGYSYAFFSLKKKNHVKHVVQTYTRSYGIIPHFVVGSEAVDEPGIIRDSIRSWFWIKN